MSIKLRDISCGDTLQTETGEFYTYIGYYKGEPRSMYSRPDEGYLYIFYGNAGWNKITDSAILDNIIVRASMGIDGMACYTKSPKKFESIAHHTELRGINIEHWGELMRLGDKKPSAIRQSKEK